jgi:hypothetical protein
VQAKVKDGEAVDEDVFTFLGEQNDAPPSALKQEDVDPIFIKN